MKFNFRAPWFRNTAIIFVAVLMTYYSDSAPKLVTVG